MENNTIRYNKALIGGGVRFFEIFPKFIENYMDLNNVLEENEAVIFGNDVTSVPSSMQINLS